MKIPKKEICNLSDYLIDFILPRLIAFRKMKREGYPSILKNMSQWNRILDKIIFSFDYTKNGSINKFYNKRNIKDPYRKRKDNLRYFKEYKMDDGRIRLNIDQTPEPKYPNLIGIKPHYQDIKLVIKYDKKAQEGFKLFGKYFNHFWD